MVSAMDETVDVAENGNAVRIQKGNTAVTVESSYGLNLPYERERIFNLVPGLQALRIQLYPHNGKAGLSISV